MMTPDTPQGLRAEVRLAEGRVVLPVRGVIRHPNFAATKCLVEPCGPTRYNAEHDVAVVHVDPAPLWDALDSETVHPACLHYGGKASQVARLGWPGPPPPQLKNGDFQSRPEDTVAQGAPRTKETELNACLEVASSTGGRYVAARDSICHPADGAGAGRGDLLLARRPDGRLALVGLGQGPDGNLPRRSQSTAAWLPCSLAWVAAQHGRRWAGPAGDCNQGL